MNNQELELKIREILNINNYFDMIEALESFEKEYKTTDFFKITKKPLADVIKDCRSWYFFDNLNDKIQKTINNLDFTKITQIITELGETYSQENEDVLNIIKEFQEIVK